MNKSTLLLPFGISIVDSSVAGKWDKGLVVTEKQLFSEAVKCMSTRLSNSPDK